MKKIIIDAVVFLTLILVVMFVYRFYGDQILDYVLTDRPVTMYVESTPISVTVADDQAERALGLSGTPSLKEFEGKLFIFDRENYYGMWMKDMLINIDIIWINNDLEIVHIEENVSPDTYPDTFTSTVPARFVLETSAFFARNANVVVGDKVVLPSGEVPKDLLPYLQ